MTKKLRVVLAQLNLTVGDIQGNLQKYIQSAIHARDEMSADVIVFPELGITGYPAEDLLLRPAFIEQEQIALKKMLAEISGIHCLVSHTTPSANGLHNACSLFHNHHVVAHYAKQSLPNYSIFDEERYFVAGDKPTVATINGIEVGLVICEDLWVQRPTQLAVEKGARIILSPNASPFEVKKHEQRIEAIAKNAKNNNVPIVYVNNVGGQDDLVFDGGSMVFDQHGQVAQFAGFFEEKLLAVDIDVHATHTSIQSIPFVLPSDEERIYQALVLATRDFFNKNAISGAILGLSGGIDSALVAAIATDALGKERVRAVIMPSRFTAPISLDDAATVARNLAIQCDTVSIEPLYTASLESLAPLFKDKPIDVTEENIQARCRTIILMAMANKYHLTALTTSNRSELAVGYCTLYGDMAGGFAPLKDVPKTWVYKLTHYRNQISPIIPKRIIERAPTAELASNQKDEDSLPPYAILDDILERYLNQEQSLDDIISAGFSADLVKRIVNLVHNSEFKRKQSAIGPRINKKAFGKDWRYPVTNRWRG